MPRVPQKVDYYFKIDFFIFSQDRDLQYHTFWNVDSRSFLCMQAKAGSSTWKARMRYVPQESSKNRTLGLRLYDQNFTGVKDSEWKKKKKKARNFKFGNSFFFFAEFATCQKYLLHCFISVLRSRHN